MSNKAEHEAALQAQVRCMEAHREETKFVIRYKVKKNDEAGYQPTWCWVCKGEWGPGGVDDRGFMPSGPLELQTFVTRASAIAFMEGFHGHPWDRMKEGPYEVIEVKPRMVSVQQGWERV